MLFTGALLLFQGAIYAGTPPPENPEKKDVEVEEALYKSIFSRSEQVDSTLLADNVKLKDKKRADELNRVIEESILAELTREELDYPAIDLYGEESWHRNAVNPFVGSVKANIPDTFSIDCTQFTCPLDTNNLRVTSHYGYRRRFGRMHYGIDIKLQTGDTVRAAFDGKVRMVKYERRGYGHYVVVRHPNGLETVYGHLSKAIVNENDIVHAGDPIALGGSTGRSTGPHLHFETRFMGIAINPNLIIDFSTGVPRSDHYVFHKGKSSSGSTSYAKSSGNRGTNTIVVHRIKKGDTLSGIAAKYGTTVSELCRLNGINRKTVLRVGKPLRVKS